MTKTAIIALVVLAIAGTLFVRLAPSDPARWHVDPSTTQPGKKPNYHLIAGRDTITLPFSADETARRIHALLIARPRIENIAQSDDGHWATYVERSQLIGFPDYLSFKVDPRAGESTLTIYSRSRFGYSDLGMNKARVERIIEEIKK